MRSSKVIPSLTVVTVSAFDIDRLRTTLTSLIEVSTLDIEHITVLPADDYESIALWHEICGEIPSFQLLHDHNAGIYPAMNLGGMAATGKYLGFWNSGDRVTNFQQAKSLTQLLGKTAVPQVITQGEIEWLPNHIQNEETLSKFINGESGGFISHQTYFIKNDFFREIGGFSKSYRVAADTDLILGMALQETYISNDIVPVFVQNPQFASRNNRAARIEILKINLRLGVRSRNFRRLINFVQSEFAGLIANKNKVFESPVTGIKDQENISIRNYKVVNFGRASILNTFSAVSKSILGSSKLSCIGVIGGSLADPEVEVLKELYPDAIIESLGIEDADHFLDLNNKDLADLPRYDILLVSQVIEHVWNHENFFDNIVAMLADNGFVWVACPASNKVHGSPDYFSAGLTHAYLVNNLMTRGVNSLAHGSFGTKRLYLATHLIPGWLSRKGHAFPLFFAFGDRRLPLRWALRARFLPELFLLSLISPKSTPNVRWHTESWVLGQK